MKQFGPVGLMALSIFGSSAYALDYELEAPHLRTEADTLYCTNGLHLKVVDEHFAYGQVEVLANGLRWNQKQNILFLTGEVTVLSKDYTLRADHVGFNVAEQTGEAWNVDLTFLEESKRVRIHCDRMLISPEEYTLFGVYSDNGHGSLFNIRASRIRVRRADIPHAHRSGISAKIDDITINNPRMQMGGVPFFWLPALYRDFRLDYPWSHVEFGHASDSGAFVRMWLGIDLPRIGDLSSKIRIRNDHYELSGRGIGVELDWKSKTIGQGSFYKFQMDPEILYTDITGGFPDLDDLALNNLYDKMHGTRVTRRKAEAWEFEHKAQIPHGAVYIRWSELPESITGELDHDKFRADYLESQMQDNPLARQGASLAWSMSLLNIAYDRAEQAFEDSQYADRSHSLHLNVIPLHILGDIHMGGDLWFEQFQQENTSILGDPYSEAWRIRGDLSLHTGHWYQAWGYDAHIGIEALSYEDTTLEDVKIDDQQASMFVASFGLKTRIVGDFDNGIHHKFLPRIGFEYAAEANGDELTTYDVGDERHELEDDQQFLVLDLDNTVYKGDWRFRLYDKFRFGIRDIDLEFEDDDGFTQEGKDSLVNIENDFTGNFANTFSVKAEFDYDGLRREWSTLDTQMNWTINQRVALRWETSLVPQTATNEAYWQHEPHILLQANRYAIDFATIHREDGDSIDGVNVQLKRQMVDGKMSIGYKMERDENGDKVDERINFSISIGAGL